MTESEASQAIQPVPPDQEATPPESPAEEPEELSWWTAVEKVSRYVVKVATPDGYGTGFLFAYAGAPEICGIATAAHVILKAHTWEQPIRLDHPVSGKSVVFRYGERALQIDRGMDTAAVIVLKSDLPFPGPSELLPLAPKGRRVKVGVQLGWVGFPALSPDTLCFFAGPVSAWLKGRG